MVEIIKGENRYSIKKSQTEEWHVFPAKNNSDGGCTLLSVVSICEKMNKNDKIGVDYQCKTEEQARIQCARIGRQICGVCLSHLYRTLTDEEIKRMQE